MSVRSWEGAEMTGIPLVLTLVVVRYRGYGSHLLTVSHFYLVLGRSRGSGPLLYHGQSLSNYCVGRKTKAVLKKFALTSVSSWKSTWTVVPQ